MCITVIKNRSMSDLVVCNLEADEKWAIPLMKQLRSKVVDLHSNWLFLWQRFAVIKYKLQLPELENYHHSEPCCHVVSVCHLRAPKDLKASVQIQMPDLFFFVYREPFLSGTDTSVCETHGLEASFALAAELLSSCHLRLRSVRRWYWETVPSCWQQCVAPRALRSEDPEVFCKISLKCTTKGIAIQYKEKT